MPELPESMLPKGRPADQEFSQAEKLYRRVPDLIWSVKWTDEDIELDCIAFPDMSVTRARFGTADCARWNKIEYLNWGVIGFLVSGIPSERRYQGAFIYRFRPVHRPSKYCYAHTEVQVFESRWEDQSTEVHIVKSMMEGVPLAEQQIWRELLRRECKVELQPGSPYEG